MIYLRFFSLDCFGWLGQVGYIKNILVKTHWLFEPSLNSKIKNMKNMMKKIISKPVLHETTEPKPKLTIPCSSSCSKRTS